jgi:hypothetical protein
VKAFCSWCRREGREGYLGEREPLSVPGETHGICLRHREQVLATLPLGSRPDVRLLIVVDRDQSDVYAYLTHSLRGVRGVCVLLDRRQAERRRTAGPVVVERRRGERRLRLGRRYEGLGVQFLRFSQPEPS